MELGREGRYAEARRRRELALRSIELTLETTPDDARVLNDSAAALADLGDLERAEQLLSRARDLAPQDPDILFNLSTILWRMGQFRAAARLAEVARERAPRDPGVREVLDRIRGTLSVYEGRVALLPGPAADIAGSGDYLLRTDRIQPLHVLRMSLPHHSSGYSYRSHEILLGQQQNGMFPAAVTAPFFPGDLGLQPSGPVESLEGVIYHRLAGSTPGTDGEAPGFDHDSELFRRELRQPLDAYLAFFARELLGLARRIRPSLIHSHSNHRNALVGRSVADALNVPHVYEVRGLWEETLVSRGMLQPAADRYQMEREMETRCCHEADAVVTLSRTLKDELASRGVEPRKIFLVPNAANPERFPLLEARSEKLARELALGSGPVIGYAGTLSAYEGVSDLLRAFRLILRVIPTARALIIGGGRDAERAHATADELQLGSAVIFTNKVDREHLLDYYSLIDVFVVPRPPFRVCEIVTPLKPYEAMATGRAVVVSDVAALQEMIIEGETALSFKAGCADSLAAACIELCNDPERRRALGAKAARWVRRNRTWRMVTAGYMDAYAFARQEHGGDSP